jgi:hypothetical protein
MHTSSELFVEGLLDTARVHLIEAPSLDDLPRQQTTPKALIPWLRRLPAA